MKYCGKYLLMIIVGIFSLTIYADVVIPMHLVAEKGVGKAIGTITVKETPYGLLFTPNLHNLTPGIHGFHVHQNPSCDNMGMAAGDHLDPQKTGEHLGPYNDGHLGDIAVLIVDKNGKATLPQLAPRLKLSDITGHALMIHKFGDNYSDQPEKLGGGGPRLACGVIN